MVVKRILKAVISVPVDFFNSMSSVRSGVTEVTKYKSAKVLFVYDGKARIQDCDITPDLGWIIPKNFNLRFRNNRSLLLEPDNVPLYICSIDNPQTLDLDVPPTMDTCDRDVMNIEEVKGKPVKTYDIEKFKLKGGRILSELSYLIGTSTIMKLIEPPSKREILYIAGLSGLFCFILGIFAYGIFLT